MSEYRSSDVAQAARGLSETTAMEIDELRKVRSENTAGLNEAVRQREEEALRLAVALLPELSPAALAAAGRLTGCPALSGSGLIDEREEDRRARTAELAEIEADSRFTDAEHLLGRLGQERADQLAVSGPARELAEKVRHPLLNRLIESGYDTTSYRTAFWQLEYYDDWKSGDEILERFPNLERFAQVRVKILEAWNAVEESDRAIAGIDSQIAGIEAVKKRREELRDYLEHLDERHLERAHECLIQYLLDGDMAEIGRRLSAEPSLAESFKAVRGVAAKALYLERIDTQLGAELDQLNALREKADRDSYKWQRPKRAGETLADVDFERRYITPREKMRRRRERYSRMTQTIRGYDGYGRATFAGSVLWWDVFTDGAFDGDFIPEVAAFRHDHPDYQGPHHLDAEEAAAAAEAGLHYDASGSGRLVDES